MPKRELVLIAHNLRSAHNAGSLLRTADGLGVTGVFLTGYSPHPPSRTDERLPHEQQKILKAIQKTALGAEDSVNWQHSPDIEPALTALKHNGFTVAALEQTSDSQPIDKYQPPDKLALIVGREVEGIEPEILKMCDVVLEIPMLGKKESFNVAQAAAMALYRLTYH